MDARRRFNNVPRSAAAVQNLAQGDRTEAPNIDADVELARQRLQPAVRVTVQIDPALAHAAPTAKRVMAEDQANPVRLDLEIGLDALPTLEFSRCRRIVVAGDEMLMAIEASEQIRDHGRALANGEIAEVPDHIVRSDSLVPLFYQRLIHLCHRREGPPIESQRATMAEMRVAGEE